MPTITAPKLGSVMVLMQTAFATIVSSEASYMGEPVTSSVPDVFIMTGSDGDPESDAIAEFTHTWVDMGQTRMREDGTVPCALVSQTGEDDIATTIASAFATLQACINTLESDPSLSNLVLGIGITAGSARQISNEDGIAVVVPFTATYWAHV